MTSYEDVPPSGDCAKCFNSKRFSKVSSCSITDRSNPPAVAATIQAHPADSGPSCLFLLRPRRLRLERRLAPRARALRVFIQSCPDFNQKVGRTMPLDLHDALRNSYPEPHSAPVTERRRLVLRPAARFAGRKRP